LSENVPVAMNCCVVPAAMLGLAGVTAMDWSVAAVTFRVVEPETAPEVAVMVVEPTARAVAKPFEPAALLMAALAASEELQATEVVRSWVVLSENVPVAMHCCVVPAAMLGLVGVTAMETSVATVTFRVVVPETAPRVAVMVVEPAASVLALPLEPATLLMVALVASEELQATEVVRSWVVLSENVPVAMNCWTVPVAMDGLVGVTAMEDNVAVETVRVVVPEMAPKVAVMVVEPAARAVALPLEPATLLMVALVASEELQVTVAVRFLVVLFE